MLNFSKEHRNLEGSISTQKHRRLKSLLASGMLLTSICLFSGCSLSEIYKNSYKKCEITEEPHAHKYVSDDGFYLYGFDNFIYDNGELYYAHKTFKKTDEYISLCKEEQDYYKFIRDTGLISIDENSEAIEQLISQSRPNEYVVFEYAVLEPVFSGKVVTPRTVHYWTSDPNTDGLTGNIKLCKEVYFGYNVEKDEDGKYKLVKSPGFDSLDELKDSGYEYVDLCCFTEKEYSDIYSSEYVSQFSSQNKDENSGSKVKTKAK